MLKQFLLVGVLASACGAALADHPGRGGRLFENADANADGSIARDEFLAARAAAFVKFDQNGDGVLDDADRREPEREGRRHDGMKARLDANSDGKITKEEFVNAATPMFDSADKDGNGALDNQELSAAKERMHEFRRRRRDKEQ
jgi:Ca2+-binding EF-hand superfamily protein